MPFSLWIALLLVPAIAQAQSGDKKTDHGLRILCTSHISTDTTNSLTCNLVGNDGDDEDDDECGEIERMSVSFRDMATDKVQHLERQGNNIKSAKLNVLTKYNLTVELNGGCIFKKPIDLRLIVKPKSPQVWNATFHQRSNRAVIHIRNPYQTDYLKPNNQLFQLDISSAEHSLIQNTTSEYLPIEGEHLHKNTEYHVKVRAIPNNYFQGTWSDWSAPLNFSTHTDVEVGAEEESQVLLCFLTVSLVALLLVTWSIAFFWGKKIHACMWPSIPHPKHTLVQIYKPIKGPPVSFDPKVFSDLNIHLVHKIEEQPCTEEEPLDGGDIKETSQDPCSIQFSEEDSDSTSAGSDCTEESALTLLSSTSTVGREVEEYPQAGSGGPPPAGILLELGEGLDTSWPEDKTGDSDPEMYGTTQQGKDEAYVTMSSFYQIKK